MKCGSISGRVKKFFSNMVGSGAHLISYLVGTGGFSPGVKRSGLKQTINIHIEPWLIMSADEFVLMACTGTL
jgi:hypothetical protein